MLRTFVYSISLPLFLTCSPGALHAQDTIPIPLKIKIGMEVSGPAIHYSDKNISNTEAYLSIDLNEKRSAIIALGYLNFKYSQYNYAYLNKGGFLRIGMDFNLLNADKSMGKYFAGIGLRYGLSRFNSEIPVFEKGNYWGLTSSSISRSSYWAHFVEASPGVRAEIFNHFSVGWLISIRMLLHSGSSKDLRPVYFPGFGNGTKTFSTGIGYFIVWNIPYKKINAILKKEAPEEPEENEQDKNNSTTTGNGQQGTNGR